MAEIQEPIDSGAAMDAIMAENPPTETNENTPDPAANIPAARKPVGTDSGDVAVQEPPEGVVSKEAKSELPKDPAQLDEYLDKFQAKTPNQEQGFPPLKTHIKELAKAVAERDQKIADYEKQLESSKGLPADVEEKLKEYQMMKMLKDPASDPEIQEKYVKPREAKDKMAIQILTNHGLKPRLAELIERAGGFAAVASSQEKAPDEFGSDKTWSEVVEDILLPRTPVAERRRLESLMSDSLNLKDEMERFVNESKANAEQRMQAQFEAAGKDFVGGLEEIASSLGVMAQRWEPKADATDEQKQIIKDHNEALDEVAKYIATFQQNLSSPKEVGKMAAMAGQAHYLIKANSRMAKELDTARAALAEVQDKLGKIKHAGSPVKQTNAPQKTEAPAPPKNQSADQAIDAFFKTIDSQ